MKYLIFDIETCPRKDLTAVQKEDIFNKVKKKMDNNPSMAPDEIESLVCSVSPFYGQVICIGMKWYDDISNVTKDIVLCEKTEEETLNKFFNIINHDSCRGVKFVHYNGLGFDVPFLMIRATSFNIKITNKSFLNLRRFSFQYHVDLMMFLCSWDKYNAPKLALACEFYGIESPKGGDVEGSSVASAFERGDIKAIEEYVSRDVSATFELFMKLKDYII